MSARILDGKAIAESLNGQTAEEVRQFVERTGVTPRLAAVLVGDNAASAVYVRNKQRACGRAGMGSTLHALPGDASQNQLLELLGRLNEDDAVHGILVQLPLPQQIDEQTVLDAVAPWKDVDCFHPENVGRMTQGRPRFLPCTPAGCLHLIAQADAPTAGAHAVVIGRSEIVGKPLALLLARKGPSGDATVTIAHSRTRDLAQLTRQADILIAAIGRANFVTAEMVKPGACVIDVGINRVGEKLVGDVEFNGVREIAGALTPVPGGVGPMTIAMLLRNTLAAARLQTAAASSEGGGAGRK